MGANFLYSILDTDTLKERKNNVQYSTARYNCALLKFSKIQKVVVRR
jgi:hypothetical protein